VALRPGVPKLRAVRPARVSCDDAAMRYGIVLTTADARISGELAAAAESAGWDGAFTYDAVSIADTQLDDPWITLAAMALATERVTLGAMVFAPTRRRPWLFAKEAFTLDRLSGGRLVLPVGLGALDDKAFANVGEPVEARERAAILDEALAIVERLSSGSEASFEGEHYRFGPMALRPSPVQQPRIPVWPVGAWPHAKSMSRALRWDGVVVQLADGANPAHLAEVTAWLTAKRVVAAADAVASADGTARPFEVIVDGMTPASDPAAAASITRAHADAGATWWIEADWQHTELDALRARIAAGPPRH
jgi:alkanesulfonate monooxygenase SsuD/methylene tetrahydromethanopterin reductase-like flavin-dependent oxidoreductase (luciferase family)